MVTERFQTGSGPEKGKDMNDRQRLERMRPKIDAIRHAIAPTIDIWSGMEGYEWNHGKRHDDPAVAGAIETMRNAMNTHSLPWITAEGQRLSFCSFRDGTRQPIVVLAERTRSSGKPSRDLRASEGELAWYLDQQDRGRWKDDMFHGPAVYDPLLRRALEMMSMSERRLKDDIAEDIDYVMRGLSMLTYWRSTALRGAINWANVNVRRNAIGLEAGMPAGDCGTMQWKNGYLLLDSFPFPSSIHASIRGRRLDALVSHPLIDGQDIVITGISKAGDKTMITTDAADRETWRTHPFDEWDAMPIAA